MSAKYFAENLRAMLQGFEHETSEESDELILNAARLTNIKHYKYCFAPMFESNKYPRVYLESLVFDRNMVEVLQSEELGVQHMPGSSLDMAYHFDLEDYLFKNALDFTTEQITFTMAAKRHKSVSPYGRFLAAMFGCDVPWQLEYIKASDYSPLEFYLTDIPPKHLPKKEQYSLLEFCLCPRCFLHQQEGCPAYLNKFQLQFYFHAVLFAETTKAFCQYNRDNKKIYSIDNEEAAEQIMAMLQPVFEHYTMLFPIFSAYELRDIHRTVTKRLRDSVADMPSRGIEGKRFTVIDATESKSFLLNGFELLLDYDTVIHDLDNRNITRTSQNSIFEDFLVLKTQENKSQDKLRYRQLKAELKQRKPGIDRINHLYKMLLKLNVQFSSGEDKYIHGADGGVERVNALIDEVWQQNYSPVAQGCVSGYCVYCPIRDICKEEVVLR